MKSLLDFDAATEKLPVEKYQEYLGMIRLADVTLEGVEADVNRSVMEEAEAFSLKLERKFRLTEEGTTRPRLLLEYNTMGLSGKKQAIKIKAVYRIQLEAAEQLPEEFFAIYGNISADSQAWPYLRELAASLTSRMGAPRLSLPLLTDPSVLNSPNKTPKTKS